MIRERWSLWGDDIVPMTRKVRNIQLCEETGGSIVSRGNSTCKGTVVVSEGPTEGPCDWDVIRKRAEWQKVETESGNPGFCKSF